MKTTPSGPGQYVLAYVQSFITAGATEADKPRMAALLAEARRILAAPIAPRP